MFWIPDADVGGVILGNGPAWLFTWRFVRKTLEVLFAGNAEAEDDAAARIAQQKASISAERKRLTLPPDPDVASKLAKKYTNPSLGDIVVTRNGAACTFDFGGWSTPVASRKNTDGTMSLVAIAPGAPDDTRTFVVGQKDAKRTLVLREMQHEYVFVQAD